MKRPLIKAKPNEIIRFWAKKLIELGKTESPDLDLSDEEKKDVQCINRIKEKFCFACGLKTAKIQRAHIFPYHLGGSDEASNLHLLCPKCHLESECLIGDLYWFWFNRKNVYDAYDERAIWHLAVSQFLVEKAKERGIKEPNLEQVTDIMKEFMK
jgi:HNH endonuclease